MLTKYEPKHFWKIIKKMNKREKQQHDPVDDISPGKWKTHFQALLNKVKMPNQENEFPKLNSFEPVLDGRINAQELRDALKGLKIGKAPGQDQILVEYLKVFGNTYECLLLKIVNKIFSSHIYPIQRNTSFLKPIHTKGYTDDPNNFRGLAIGSAFAKLFSMILLQRLNKFVTIKKILSPNQIGFVKGHSTSDHIFLLQTMIEKIVKKDKSKLYTAFIDFTKAYDTVDRQLSYCLAD